jgi:D-lactate dehydrogenase (cytochrome)
MKRMSMAEDVKTLGKVIAKEKSLGKGLLAAEFKFRAAQT